MQSKKIVGPASLADILGFSRAPKIPEQWKAHYAALLALRSERQAKFAEFDRSVATDRGDDADVASGEQNAWVQSRAVQALQSELSEIQKALERIEKNRYGICEITGQPIDPARLLANPAARFSKAGDEEFTHSRKVKEQAAAVVEVDDIVEPGDVEETETDEERDPTRDKGTDLEEDDASDPDHLRVTEDPDAPVTEGKLKGEAEEIDPLEDDEDDVPVVKKGKKKTKLDGIDLDL